MKVRELIEKLEELDIDQELQVMYRDDELGPMDITEVSVWDTQMRGFHPVVMIE